MVAQGKADLAIAPASEPACTETEMRTSAVFGTLRWVQASDEDQNLISLSNFLVVPAVFMGYRADVSEYLQATVWAQSDLEHIRRG